jgi:hypothetical protein
MALQRSTQPSGSRFSCLARTSDEDWAASEPIEDATPSNNTEVFRFMDLPVEMRRLMYSYFLSIPPGEEFQMDQSLVDWSFSTTSAAILKVSKEIYDEAFPVFLRQNRFLIGSSLTSPNILKDFGTERCAYVRFLSIHFNDRPTNDCIQILDNVNKYCEEIRHLELRVSPGSLILPHLTSMLPSRADAGATSRANIVFRCSIRKTDAILGAEQDIVDRAARRVEKSFKNTFRWGWILKRARDVTVKGCIYKSSLDALEGFACQGWYLEKTSTLPVLDCSFREEVITRTLKCREEGAGARVGADVEEWWQASMVEDES